MLEPAACRVFSAAALAETSASRATSRPAWVFSLTTSKPSWAVALTAAVSFRARLFGAAARRFLAGLRVAALVLPVARRVVFRTELEARFLVAFFLARLTVRAILFLTVRVGP